MKTRFKPLPIVSLSKATFCHDTNDPRKEMGNCVALTILKIRHSYMKLVQSGRWKEYRENLCDHQVRFESAALEWCGCINLKIKGGGKRIWM